MVAIRDIAAEFVEVVPETGLVGKRTSPMYPALLYCEVVEDIIGQLEVVGSDFRIKPYWSTEVMTEKIEQYERDLIGRQAYLTTLLSGVRKRMSKHFVTEVSVDDFALFKLGDSIGAGRYCGNGIYQAYHKGQRQDCALVSTPDLICKLTLVDFVSEGLPAVVAQADRWSVGFPEFKEGGVEITTDLDGEYFFSEYINPFMIRGLLPVRREKLHIVGPYR